MNETSRTESFSVDWKDGDNAPDDVEYDSRQHSHEQPSLHFPDDDLPTDERIDRVIQVLTDAVASEISRDRPAPHFSTDAGDVMDAGQEERPTTASLAMQTAADLRPDCVSSETVSWRATPDPTAFDIVEPESHEGPTDAGMNIDDLVEDAALDSSKRTTDAWERDFQLECSDGNINVVSAGPDGQFGSEDDVQ